MKTIYKAGNIVEAHIVAGMLEAGGIHSEVAGHYLQGATGETAAMDFARVLIADDDYEAALPMIADYEQNKLVDETVADAEEPEELHTAMGIFTKPVLFWVAVFLLVWWFIF